MKKEKAIIIGASMAGLLAARICADHFEEVLILEKDELPGSPEHRKGVPQDQQLHLLLSKGYQIITKLFPGIVDTLAAEGAISGDLGLMLRWYGDGGFRPQCETGQYSILMSRPLLEYTIRKALLRKSNVRIMDKTRVLAYQFEQGGITGVQTNLGSLKSDLTIDTCGMASSLGKQLVGWGYDSPNIEEVHVNVRYTSCLFPRPTTFTEVININSEAPLNSKHGTVQAIENNKMIVMVQGRSQDKVPKDVESLKAYTAQLAHPLIYDTIKDADALSPLTHYHIPSVRWVHFETLNRFPPGLLCLGDAICRLNPVYGQGMSSAAMQAEVLDSVLGRSPLKVIWKSYFKQVAQLLKTPWEVTLAEDFKFPETEGIPPKIPKLIERYFSKLSRVMNQDPVLFKAFVQVLNLVKPPTSLLRPSLIWRVIRAK